MNVKKTADYSTLYAALDTLMAANLPQMELYCEIGCLVSGRQEKGAAVAAAEHLHSAYPDVSGFSPRNLRRMRDFCSTYEDAPEMMAEAMGIGWTQNAVILEAELALQEKAWYIRAVRQFGWSKLELSRKIQEHTHEAIALDSTESLCYSNGSGGEENGEKETSRAFLQGPRDEKVQREFQRQGPRGAYLQSLFPALTRPAGRADGASPPGKPAASPFDRERDDVAEKSNPRSPARGESIGVPADITVGLGVMPVAVTGENAAFFAVAQPFLSLPGGGNNRGTIAGKCQLRGGKQPSIHGFIQKFLLKHLEEKGKRLLLGGLVFLKLL